MDCELLIIGGGASGQVAALSAIKHGIENVFIVEKSDKIGGNICQKIDLCTPDIHLDEIVKDLKLQKNYTSNHSKWFSPSNEIFDFKSRIPDYWFKRGPTKDSFDVKTADQLIKKGGKILLGHKGIKIKNENNYVKTSVKNKDKIIHIKSKTVVSSEGLNTTLLKNNKFLPITSSGIFGRKFEMEKGIPHIFFDAKRAYGSYVFALKDPNDEIGYIINGFLDNNRIVDPVKKFQEIKENNKIIKKTLKNAEIQGSIYGTLFVAKPLPKIGFKNNLLTGDSAHLMDPLLHYGLKQAIISGYYAGRIISYYLKDTSYNYIKEYNKFYYYNLKPKLDEGYFYRKIFNKIDNKDIDILFKILNDFKKYNINFDDLFDCPQKCLSTILKIIITNPICFRLLPKILTSII